MPDWLTYLGDALVSVFFGILGFAGVHLSEGTALGAVAVGICYAMILLSIMAFAKNLRGMVSSI